MTNLVPLPLTGRHLADAVLATLGADRPVTDRSGADRLIAGGAWTVGVTGAIAEMRFGDDDGPVDLRRTGSTIEARTPRGGLRFTLDPTVRAFVDPTPDTRSPVLLAVPRPPRPPPPATLTILGPDVDALDPTARGEILVDLGLGRAAASFAVRTGDPDLLDLLRRAAGLLWPDALAACGQQLVAASPTRVVRTAVVRAEVHTPIPSPGQRSPDGPHTHLLPRLVELGRDLPDGLALPAGYITTATYHPSRPDA